MELGPSDFDGKRLKNAQTSAVVFLASWCPFCQRFRPLFEVAAKQNTVPWAIADVSEDENELWDVFNIKVVPTVVVFKNGEPMFRRDGVPGRGLSEEAIEETMAQMKLLGAAN